MSSPASLVCCLGVALATLMAACNGSDEAGGGGASPPPATSNSLRLQTVTAVLSSPVFLTAPTGDVARLFIVEQGGLIRILNSLDGTPRSIRVDDLNSDGNADLIVATAGLSDPTVTSGVWALMGRGNATFDSPVVYSGMGQITAVNATDVNGDRSLDVVFATVTPCSGRCGGARARSSPSTPCPHEDRRAAGVSHRHL